MFIIIFLSLLVSSTIVTKSKKSVWFLSLGAVLKTLGLAIPIWVGATLFPTLLGWQCFLIFIFAVATQAPLNAVAGLAALSILFLVGSLFWYLLLVGLYSLVLRLLWSETPQFLRWLEPPKKKRNVFFGWVASALAILVGVTPIVTLVYTSFLNDFSVYNLRYREDLFSQAITDRLQSLSEEMFIAWFIVCAYFYQLRNAYNQPAAKKRKTKQVSG